MNDFYISDSVQNGDTVGIFKRELTVSESLHRHGYFDIIIPDAGSACISVDGNIYEAAQGTFFFIDRTVEHSIKPTDKIQYTEILLTTDFFDSQNSAEVFRRLFYSDDNYIPCVSLNKEELSSVVFITQRLDAELSAKAGDYRDIMRTLMLLEEKYLSRAIERAKSEIENRDPQYIITVTLEYVDKHFTENISQEELATRFHYNSAYFSRMFKKHKGMNFSDYITGKRIDLASTLLKETDLSAEAISEKVGYKSKPQFYNTFTKITGLTPRQYRIDSREGK